MLNFYNYFNFFYFSKKYFFNIILSLSNVKKNILNFLIFFVNLKSNKIIIKNAIEFFLEIKITKLNTLISKKNKFKKKAFVYFNDFI